MAYKVIHYINQFFAGIGGEEAADFEPKVFDSAVGPGVKLQELLSDEAKIVATIVCGDNYFAINKDAAIEATKTALLKYKPDIIIAGPSFSAGRYGFACGEVISTAKQILGIPGIAGMNIESPAVKMYSNAMFIVKTGDSVRYMQEALKQMSRLALKILKKEFLGPADTEGYFPRGMRKNFFVEKRGATRAVEMLIKKMSGLPFDSEYIQATPEKVLPAPELKDLKTAKIALCTTGGIVPEGNPDRIEGSAATKYGSYSLSNIASLDAGKFIPIHGGYDTHWAFENPNRIVPVDILRELEQSGDIGKLHEIFYSTTGTGASLQNCEQFGREIAQFLLEDQVDGVLLIST